MTGEQEACRPVTLPSGETIRVHMGCAPTPEEAAAIGEIVTAARKLHTERNPPDTGAVELWARVVAVRERAAFHLEMRELAREAGLRSVTLFRLAQGRMPEGRDLARIEAWLARDEGDG